MTTEPRTYEAPAIVTHVARYMPAERTGVIKGDIILAFGTLSPAEVIENREAMAGLKRHDWLLIQRGTTVFKLAFGEGLEGCLMEAHARVEVDLPTGVDYPTWWGGVQSGGAMVLIPDKISRLWALLPSLLYVRFRNWMMFTATSLVWLTAYIVEGPVTLIIAYLITVAVAALGGPSMLRDASEKQGYIGRGHYAIASYRDAAALEIVTEERLNPHKIKKAAEAAAQQQPESATA